MLHVGEDVGPDAVEASAVSRAPGPRPPRGLLNFFGQHAGSIAVSSPVATLKVTSPARLRSGLLYIARIQIIPRQDIKQAVLVLDSRWLEGMTVNAIEPSPSMEESKHGRLALSLGAINAGDPWNEYVAFQVNPTTVGARNGSVALYDGAKKLMAVTRSATVFP